MKTAADYRFSLGASCVHFNWRNKNQCPDCLEATFADAIAAAKAEEKEACARVCDDWSAQYPTSAWPENGESVDCISASMGRHSGKMIGERIRARAVDCSKEPK